MSRPVSLDNFQFMSEDENVRMRHCTGCKYAGTCGAYGCCNYYLITGKRRPCKFGTKCPVKELRKGFTLPDDYEEWCAKLDAEMSEKEQAEKERLRQQKNREKRIRALLTEAEKDRNDAIAEMERKRMDQQAQGDSFQYKLPRKIDFRKAPVPSKGRGRPLTWDVDYAFSLFVSGFYIVDIADILQIDFYKLQDYIKNHGWSLIEDRNKNFRRADLPFEWERYDRWKLERQKQKVNGPLKRTQKA